MITSHSEFGNNFGFLEKILPKQIRVKGPNLVDVYLSPLKLLLLENYMGKTIFGVSKCV